MQCPHCHQEIPGTPCPGCGAVNPEAAEYCMGCGSPVNAAPAEEDSGGDEGVDFDSRVLCPDGTCTGIIENGRCTECGKAPGEVKETGQPSS